MTAALSTEPRVGEDALACAHRAIEQLEGALRRRTTIGQALGILMERYSLDDQQAFTLLSGRSQATNRKLYDLACELVGSGHAAGM